MADKLEAYIPTKEHPGVSDVPRSPSRGFHPPVLDEVSVRFHELRSAGHSDESARKQLGIDAGHPIETPDLIAHKKAVRDRLEAEAAEDVVRKRARIELGARVRGKLAAFGPDERDHLLQQIEGVASTVPAVASNLRGLLHELGLPR